MTPANLLVATIDLTLLSTIVSPAAAHSLEDLESQLLERKTYVQMTFGSDPQGSGHCVAWTRTSPTSLKRPLEISVSTWMARNSLSPPAETVHP